ncbi:hypothetical protein COM48_22620 [Bacillus wiedmannii]|nr:hypothetical protein COM48_22620 [Bacillus wiedmannii]
MKMKKRSVNLNESDMEYLEYVAKETGKTAGELIREILEREIKKYKLVFGKPYNAKLEREPHDKYRINSFRS